MGRTMVQPNPIASLISLKRHHHDKKIAQYSHDICFCDLFFLFWFGMVWFESKEELRVLSGHSI